VASSSATSSWMSPTVEVGAVFKGIMQLKKAYLTIAFVAVTIIALLYGISPTWYAATFLGITDLNPNVAHILRAVTGLYLALAASSF
jgi:hypothetical protein